MKKLRLLLFKDCNRSCPGCCNNDWDLEALPVVDEGWSSQYDEVILTGGEPLLRTDLVAKTVFSIRAHGDHTKIYLYTAMSDPARFRTALALTDGVTLTLHEQSDVTPFINLCNHLLPSQRKGKSLRLNVFKGIVFNDCIPDYWTVKKDMKWIVNCPLPEDEVLMRLPQLTLKGGP